MKISKREAVPLGLRLRAGEMYMVGMVFLLFLYCRYPTFTDALRDMDDSLCMLFLFSSLPQYKRLQVLNSIIYEASSLYLAIPPLQAQVVHNCKRLCLEFMHYIIESRSLRKVRCTLSLPAVVISPTCGVCV